MKMNMNLYVEGKSNLCRFNYSGRQLSRLIDGEELILVFCV